MRKLFVISLLTIISVAFTDNRVLQTVTLNIASFDNIAVPVTPVSLSVTGATPGSQPSPVSASSTLTYLSTTANDKKIVGSVRALPSNTTLALTVNPIDGSEGTSQGSVPLDSTSKNLLIAIPTNTIGSATTSYDFTATTEAGVISGQNVTVTLTIQAN